MHLAGRGPALIVAKAASPTPLHPSPARPRFHFLTKGLYNEL